MFTTREITQESYTHCIYDILRLAELLNTRRIKQTMSTITPHATIPTHCIYFLQ